MASAVAHLGSNDLLNGTVANQIGSALHLDDGSAPGSIKYEIDPRGAKAANSCDAVALLGEKQLEELFELRSSHRIDSGDSGTPIGRSLAHSTISQHGHEGDDDRDEAYRDESAAQSAQVCTEDSADECGDDDGCRRVLSGEPPSPRRIPDSSLRRCGHFVPGRRWCSVKETCSGFAMLPVRRGPVRAVSAFYSMSSALERPVVGTSGDRIRQCLVGLFELLKEGVSPPAVGMHAPAEAAVGSFNLHRGRGRWQA